ncbi:MAG: hypothetical protein GX466_08860 [Candidatus Cloacimonetes bacterium]|nr:hypothetical protein [Candidatus Cloacimonadota bacterium]
MPHLTANETTAALSIARIKLGAAVRDLECILREHVLAIAQQAVSDGATYEKFLAACVANARNARAEASGGAGDVGNIVDAVTRAAWLDAGADLQMKFLFLKGE